MKYLKYTYICSHTGISVANKQSNHELIKPNLIGLEYVWAKESEYPTNIPELFGTCPDSSNTDVEGVLEVMSEQDWNNAKQLELYVRCCCPVVITAKQFRLALLETDLLDQVQTVISTLPKNLQIAWEYDTHVNRTSTLVIELAKQLSLFDLEPDETSKIDKIFILGCTL